jgi:hypothetical protein
MNKVRLLMFAFAAALVSCGEGHFAALGRTIEDPVVSLPTASSFIHENEITIRWDVDPGADEYVLEVSSGRISSPYAIVYRGSGTSYVLTGCDDQGLYLFRLSKLRGDTLFGPSDPVLGVGSSVRRDECEPNDGEAEATDLGYAKDANLFYYRAYTGAVLGDEDWYSLDVPPRMIAYVVVIQTNPAVSGTDDTRMMLYQPGLLETRIQNNVAIPLYNYSYSPQKIAFRIGPHAESFIGGFGSEGGGSTINYRIDLYRIDQL